MRRAPCALALLFVLFAVPPLPQPLQYTKTKDITMPQVVVFSMVHGPCPGVHPSVGNCPDIELLPETIHATFTMNWAQWANEGCTGSILVSGLEQYGNETLTRLTVGTPPPSVLARYYRSFEEEPPSGIPVPEVTAAWLDLIDNGNGTCKWVFITANFHASASSSAERASGQFGPYTGTGTICTVDCSHNLSGVIVSG